MRPAARRCGKPGRRHLGKICRELPRGSYGSPKLAHFRPDHRPAEKSGLLTTLACAHRFCWAPREWGDFFRETPATRLASSRLVSLASGQFHVVTNVLLDDALLRDVENSLTLGIDQYDLP